MAAPRVRHGAAPQLALPLPAPLPGGATVVGHGVPGEGENTGGPRPRPRHGAARVTRVRTLAPSPDVGDVGPGAVSGCRAPTPVVKTFVLKKKLLLCIIDGAFKTKYYCLHRQNKPDIKNQILMNFVDPYFID